jgi:SAM-dependent MidA family methyltransferase
MNQPNNLEEIILNRIRQDGIIPFKTFMETALYEPGMGYYTSEKSIIGREGDFYTSSHLHPVFGKLMGKQMREMWEFMDRPRDFQIIEIGPGAGYVCKDILDSLKHSDFYTALRYIIIELNPALVRLQKELLSGFLDKISWLTSVKELSSITGCVFSNELLDAFPVHIVQMEDVLKEVYVTADESGLKEVMGPLSTGAIQDFLDSCGVKLSKGFRTEVNLEIREWLHDLDTILQEGFIITIDYGYSLDEYFDSDRNRGTLMCYHNHQFNENPFQHIGKQDMTAHVNFSAVKKWGEELGIHATGYCSQGLFLTALGIDKEIRKLYETSGAYEAELSRIKRLVMPKGMGDTYKVMVQYKGINSPILKGFSIRNRVTSLG